MMMYTIRKTLPLFLILVGLAWSCSTPDFGTTEKDTKEPLGDAGLDTFPGDAAGACKGADLPDCKSDGICGEKDEYNIPLVYSCTQDGEWECDYSVLGEVYQNKETLCDGLDNDCDGNQDEIDDVDFATACPDLNNGVCAVNPDAVDITCLAVGENYEFLCDATAVPGYALKEFFDPQSETQGQLCDNQDNDCDGDTDEDHDYDGGQEPVPEDSYSLCQNFAGICHATVLNEDPYQASGDVIFRCKLGGMECAYDFVDDFDAPESLCDSIDNDCNGETDEVTDINESDCPHQGICEGKVTALCKEGEWLCDLTEVLADPNFQVDENRCDFVDNDCDGQIDEGLGWESIVAARCDGTCTTQFCTTWNQDCEEAIDPPVFTSADKCPVMGPGTHLPGNPSVPVLSPTGWPVLPGVCNFDPLTDLTDVLFHCMEYDHGDDGLIEGAFFGCRYDAMQAGDDPIYTDNESLFPVGGSWCDNLDNDCDGLVDQHRVSSILILDILVTDGNPQDLVWTSCRILGECGIGTTALCQNGDWECSYPGGTVEVGTGEGCEDPNNPSCLWTETKCDAKDNDCDGEVDEGIVSIETDPLTAAGCNQDGVCVGAIQAVCNEEAPGQWSCDYSDAFALGYAQLEDGNPTLCDGLDNDCDGEIDEDISAGPLDPNYLLVIDEAGCLDQGICQNAVTANCNSEAVTEEERWECEYPLEYYVNSVDKDDVGIFHEVMCDGEDNDCDGLIDENLNVDFGGDKSPKLLSGCSQSGLCENTMEWGCSQGSWTCEGDPLLGWEAEEASCDDVDNDCDGATDEDLSDTGPDGADCDGIDEGVCQVGLTANCSGGVWACSYEGVQNHEPVEVSCDGLDNDCDGATDEDLDWETSPGVGACLSQGVCDPQDVVAVCSGTPSGWLCNYSAISTYEPSEGGGDCDGLDNDCDGITDEQACGPCAPCSVNFHCYNNLCRSDPFGGENFCSTGTQSCVMENLEDGICESVSNGQTACITRTTRAICSFGTWNIGGVQDCAEPTPVCFQGLCKVCIPGALSCDGSNVLQCNQEGDAAFQIDTCNAGQICVGAGSCITNSEFQVDVLAASAQFFEPKPRVAGLKGGGFVMVWGSAHATADGSGTAVMGRIYDAELSPTGEPFIVNEVLEDDQGDPAVDAAAVGFGRFVVAWSTMDTPSDPDEGIAVRVFETDGTPVTGEIPVNQIVESDQSNPAVTMYQDGRFLVSWDTKIETIEDDVPQTQFDVKARYFLADGTPDGDEFTMNIIYPEPKNQRTPDVDFLPSGGLAAGWSSTLMDGSGLAVAALTLDTEGEVIVEEDVINKYEFGSQKNQVVVALEEGLTKGWFAIVWESQKQASGDGSAIFMDLINEAGVDVCQDCDIQVHQNDVGTQAMPRAARLAGDRIVVVWESDDADPDGVGIARRIFNSSGGAETNEGVVNQAITGDQLDPDVSDIDPTTFVVVWTNSYTGHVMARILND